MQKGAFQKMTTYSKPSSLSRFYARQASEFYVRDKSCKFKDMTRANYKRYENFFKHHGIREVRSAYGLHRGSRGVLLNCPKWSCDCWVMFLD
jgi:hypothetical protein